MRSEITQICDRVAVEAHRLGLPVTVMHLSRRPAGRADRWATAPTPRCAVGFLTTTDTAEAARQVVTDWVDAQTAVGRTVTDAERVALTVAAGHIEAVS